jgi:pyruvate-formate lyase
MYGINYTQYDGDESFLEGPTSSHRRALGKDVQEFQKQERAKGGVLDCETEVVSGLTAYGPGYIDPELKDLEKVVGLQTDKPSKRAFMPYGGIKMAQQAAETYGYKINPRSTTRSSTSTTRPTTRPSLMPTPRDACCPPLTSSPACPTPTAAAASSATTAALPSTASTS